MFRKKVIDTVRSIFRLLNMYAIKLSVTIFEASCIDVYVASKLTRK